MQIDIDHMFKFTFEKTSLEITKHAADKRRALATKVDERELRIKRVRETYKISDEMMVDMLEQANSSLQRGNLVSNYSTKSTSSDGVAEEVTIGAGVISNLMAERAAIISEKAAISKLDLIIRNLADLVDDKGIKRGHRLSFDELRYLGF